LLPEEPLPLPTLRLLLLVERLTDVLRLPPKLAEELRLPMLLRLVDTEEELLLRLPLNELRRLADVVELLLRLLFISPRLFPMLLLRLFPMRLPPKVLLDVPLFVVPTVLFVLPLLRGVNVLLGFAVDEEVPFEREPPNRKPVLLFLFTVPLLLFPTALPLR